MNSKQGYIFLQNFVIIELIQWSSFIDHAYEDVVLYAVEADGSWWVPRTSNPA